MYEYMHVCSLVDQLLYLAVGDQIHSLWYQKKTRVLAVRYLSSGVVDTQFNETSGDRGGLGIDIQASHKMVSIRCWNAVLAYCFRESAYYVRGFISDNLCQ